MRAFTPALVGVMALFIAGFVRGTSRSSADPELVFGAVYTLGGVGPDRRLGCWSGTRHPAFPRLTDVPIWHDPRGVT